MRLSQLRQRTVPCLVRAWEELDRDGYISSEVGRGSFVCELREDERQKRSRKQLCEALTPAVERCKALGLGKDALLAALEEME